MQRKLLLILGMSVLKLSSLYGAQFEEAAKYHVLIKKPHQAEGETIIVSATEEAVQKAQQELGSDGLVIAIESEKNRLIRYGYLPSNGKMRSEVTIILRNDSSDPIDILSDKPESEQILPGITLPKKMAFYGAGLISFEKQYKLVGELAPHVVEISYNAGTNTFVARVADYDGFNQIGFDMAFFDSTLLITINKDKTLSLHVPPVSAKK